MMPPHIKKYSIEKVGNIYKGYALFKSDRKIFRAEIEYDGEKWIIKGVPFFDGENVNLYEMTYDMYDRKRYIMFYLWDGNFDGRKFITSYPIGVSRVDKVVSYYSERLRYGGGIVGDYVILSDGDGVEIYVKRQLIARVEPKDVETIIHTPLGDVNRLI